MNWSQESSPMNDVPILMTGEPSLLLAPLCDSLGALNASVAEQFLGLAAILQSNSARARQITDASHKATGSKASLQSSQSIGVLQRVLTDSAAISEMVEVSAQKMLDILFHVNSVHAPLHRLATTKNLLQTVGVLSRIEGGRMKGSVVDLSSLSRDIDVLAGEVQQHLDRIEEDSSTLSGLLQTGVKELSRFEQQERTQAADLIRHTQEVLGPMIARSEALKVAARDIDEQYESFHRSTDKIVMSLQSEDIARQRLEHVQEAIRRVAASLDTGESVESCAGILALQRSQLVSTRDLLADAIKTIQTGLQSLNPRIQELVSRTAELARQSDEDGSSFAAMIENGLETISTVFKQCSLSAKSVVSIVDSVVPSAEQMTSGAHALEEIESSIHLISLNATIKTAHLGSKGDAMGVIATEVYSIAQDIGVDTRAVLDGLCAISDALRKIRSEEAVSESSLIMNGDGDVVSNELSGLSESIRSSSQEMTVGLNQVRQMAEELCAELGRGCELAVQAEGIMEIFDQQLRKFDEALEKLGYTDAMAAATTGERAGDLSALYSMESERKLHLEVFGGELAAAGSSANSDDSEFGDDVELF